MHDEVIRLVGFLAAGFPYAQVSKDTQRVYVQALTDVPIDVLSIAVNQCLADCKFFPTVAEIRECVARLSSPGRLSGPEAWEVVVNALKSGKFYFTDAIFEDRLIQICVDALDWQTLRASENPIADRAHFLKMYDSIVAQEKQNQKWLPSSSELRRQLTEQVGPQLLKTNE